MTKPMKSRMAIHAAVAAASAVTNYINIIPKRLFGLLVSLLFIVESSAVLAQEESAAEIEEIRVMGQSIERELTAQLAEFGNQLEVITSADIRKSGLNDVMQILEKLVPGLFISPRHGNRMGESDPSLQGGDDGSVLWLVDGVRVSMRIFGTFRTFIPPQYIERIEVLKDGQGLFYGTQAIDGVINIITKDGADLDNGEVSLAVGTVGDGEQSVSGLVTHRTESSDFLLFAAQNRGDAQIFRDQDFDATTLTRLRSWDVRSIGFKANKRISDSQFISLSLLRNEMEVTRPAADNYYLRTNDRTQDIFSLKYENHVNEQLAYFVKAYWHEWDTEWNRIDVADDGSLQVIHNGTPWWFEDYGFNAMATFEQDGGSEWVGGIDMQKVEGADFVTNIAPKVETVWAAFAQYRPVLQFTPDTKFALGVRYNLADEGDNSTVWSASARHPLTEQTYFRISGGTSFRNPNITELFQDQTNSTFCPLPGVNSPCNLIGSAVAGEKLAPQESQSVNLGLGGLSNFRETEVEWEIGYFDRTINDLIQEVDLDGGGNTITVRNASGKSTREGFEARGTITFTSEWTLHLNGTWVDAENDGSGEQPDLIPESFYKGYLSFDSEGGSWGAQLTGVYTGKIYDSLNPAVGGRQNFGEYATFDLSGYYNLDRFGDKRLSFRIENLLDDEEAYRLENATAPVSGTIRRVEAIVPGRNIQLTYNQSF